MSRTFLSYALFIIWVAIAYGGKAPAVKVPHASSTWCHASTTGVSMTVLHQDRCLMHVEQGATYWDAESKCHRLRSELAKVTNLKLIPKEILEKLNGNYTRHWSKEKSNCDRRGPQIRPSPGSDPEGDCKSYYRTFPLTTSCNLKLPYICVGVADFSHEDVQKTYKAAKRKCCEKFQTGMNVPKTEELWKSTLHVLRERINRKEHTSEIGFWLGLSWWKDRLKWDDGTFVNDKDLPFEITLPKNPGPSPAVYHAVVQSDYEVVMKNNTATAFYVCGARMSQKAPGWFHNDTQANSSAHANQLSWPYIVLGLVLMLGTVILLVVITRRHNIVQRENTCPSQPKVVESGNSDSNAHLTRLNRTLRHTRWGWSKMPQRIKTNTYYGSTRISRSYSEGSSSPYVTANNVDISPGTIISTPMDGSRATGPITFPTPPSSFPRKTKRIRAWSEASGSYEMPIKKSVPQYFTLDSCETPSVHTNADAANFVNSEPTTTCFSDTAAVAKDEHAYEQIKIRSPSEIAHASSISPARTVLADLLVRDKAQKNSDIYYSRNDILEKISKPAMPRKK